MSQDDTDTRTATVAQSASVPAGARFAPMIADNLTMPPLVFNLLSTLSVSRPRARGGCGKIDVDFLQNDVAQFIAVCSS